MSTALAAVIFDMDGVLIDSEPLHFDALRTLLAQVGYSLTREENERFLGTTSASVFATLIARHHLPHSVAELEERYNAAILQILHQPHQPQPGVVPLLRRLRELHLRIGVASSSYSHWVTATLTSIGLNHAFDAIVSGDEVAHSKPDPSIYLLAAERLGVRPEACLAIEDFDLTTAVCA